MHLSGIGAVADLFGVHYKTVQEWIDRGMPVRQVGAQFDAYGFESSEVIAWHVQRKLDERGEAPKDRVLRLQAEDLELEFLEMPKAEPLPAASVPSLTVVAPLKVLAPDKVAVPLPVLVSAPLPAKMAEMLAVVIPMLLIA